MKSDGILHAWSMFSDTQHVGNTSEGCKALPEHTLELTQTGKNYKLEVGKALLWSFGTLREFDRFGSSCSVHVLLGALGSVEGQDLKLRHQTPDQNL